MSGAALARLFLGGFAFAVFPVLLIDADAAGVRVHAQARERVVSAAAVGHRTPSIVLHN